MKERTDEDKNKKKMFFNEPFVDLFLSWKLGNSEGRVALVSGNGGDV